MNKIVSLLFLFLSLMVPLHAAGQEAKRPRIVVHYMPWFVAKPTSPQWGWHWTMNAFDPEKISGEKRQIASHYYPLIGPYDSGDSNVLEYHLLLMKLAGIDGVIVDWYGLSDFVDYPIIHRNTQALFQAASHMGLKFGICYEDQTVTHLVEAKKLQAGERISHVKSDIEWMRQHWFPAASYLKIQNRPVLLSFGSSGLTDAEWQQVLSANPSLLYLSEHRRRPSAAGSFDWPEPPSGLAAQDQYYRSVAKDSLFVPVAFPRFHDIYKEGKARDSYPILPDENGRTFSATFERACKSGAPLVQIATWNDWGEGTGIEPSRELGYRDLETIQRWRRAEDTRFKATAEDLRLPHRLWSLRVLEAQRPQRKVALDRIAQQLAAGDLSGARSALNSLSK